MIAAEEGTYSVACNDISSSPGDCINAKRSLNQISIVVFLYLLSVGLMIPIIPALLLETSPDKSQASLLNGYISVTKNLLEFIVMPILGACSDHIGRKPVLLISAVLATMEFLAVALWPSTAVLIVIRILGGLSNGIITMAYSTISDVSKAENDSKLAKNLGIVGAALGLAFIIGPAVGGVLGTVHESLPSFLATILMCMNVMYIYFVYFETLPINRRKKFHWTNANPLPALKIFFKNQQLFSIFPSLFLIQFAQGVVFTWYIYVSFRFNWESADVGIFFSCVGLCIAIVQGWLIKLAVPHLMGPERATVTGFGLRSIAYIGYALSYEPWMLFACIAFEALASISNPCFNAVMVDRVENDEIGTLQGAIASIKTAAQGLGSIAFSVILALFIPQRSEKSLKGIISGGHFLCAASVCTVAMVLLQRCFLLEKNNKSYQITKNNTYAKNLNLETKKEELFTATPSPFL